MVQLLGVYNLVCVEFFAISYVKCESKLRRSIMDVSVKLRLEDTFNNLLMGSIFATAKESITET